MRRLGVLMVAVALIVAGCNSDGGEGGSDEDVTLTFSDWHLTEPHWEQTLIDAIGRFEDENPNISVKLEYVSYADKETKYATEVQAREGADVMHLHAYSLRSFIDRGLAADLTPFIEEEDDGFTEQWFPHVSELMKAEDKWFALPGDFMSMVLTYNKAIFEEAGHDPNDPPQTWDEFLQVAQELTMDTDDDGKTDVWGFGALGAIDPGFELRFSPVLFSFGGQYLTDDHTCSALDQPEAQDAFQFYTDLVSRYEVVPPGVTEQNAGTVREQLANGQIAMSLGSGWTKPIVDSINPDFNTDQNLGAAPMPSQEGVTPEATTSAWLSAWTMNPHTEHPEEAWELMKFITAEEQEQQWFDDANVLSARIDVSGEGGYDELLNDPIAGVIAGELESAAFVPQIPDWPQIAETVNRAAQEAFSGTDAIDALTAAHEEINGILGCSG